VELMLRRTMSLGKTSGECLGKNSMIYRVEGDGGRGRETEHSLKYFPQGLAKIYIHGHLHPTRRAWFLSLCAPRWHNTRPGRGSL